MLINISFLSEEGLETPPYPAINPGSGAPEEGTLVELDESDPLHGKIKDIDLSFRFKILIRKSYKLETYSSFFSIIKSLKSLKVSYINYTLPYHIIKIFYPF